MFLRLLITTTQLLVIEVGEEERESMNTSLNTSLVPANHLLKGRSFTPVLNCAEHFGCIKRVLWTETHRGRDSDECAGLS